MEYSLPYVLLTVFLLVISTLQLNLNLTENSRKMFNFLVLLSFIIFFGGRGLIGWDWYNYYPFFKQLKPGTIGNGYSFEPGFVVYATWIKYFISNYNIFVLIGTTIDVVLLHLFLRRYLNTKYYSLGLVIYLAFFGFALETDLMRNVKSVLLFMVSIKYIEERKFVKFYLLAILGVLFHWSSIFFFPVYFFLHKPISFKLFVYTFIVGNIIFLFNIPYIKPILLFTSGFMGETIHVKVIHYFANQIYSKPFDLSLGYFVRQLISILIILYYDKLLKYSKSTVLFINSFFILMILYLFFSEITIAVQRLSLLFNFSNCILIPSLLEIITPIAFRTILYVLISLYMLARINTLSSDVFYKYDNFLFQDIQSYKDRMKVHDLNQKSLQK